MGDHEHRKFGRAMYEYRVRSGQNPGRCAVKSMARRLWRDQGKRDETREPLAPIYGWFTESFDTLDLKEAKGFSR
jgi:hypothetical protein